MCLFAFDHLLYVVFGVFVGILLFTGLFGWFLVVWLVLVCFLLVVLFAFAACLVECFGSDVYCGAYMFAFIVVGDY